MISHGKWVVVNAWATACPYCRHELFNLTSLHEPHQDKDAI
ncbi:MAG: redoxin domain-containing protein [Methylotenera sp.]